MPQQDLASYTTIYQDFDFDDCCFAKILHENDIILYSPTTLNESIGESIDGNPYIYGLYYCCLELYIMHICVKKK